MHHMGLNYQASECEHNNIPIAQEFLDLALH